MNDILFGNNNKAAIKRLAKRSYCANKQRNFFAAAALFLTSFMLTSVFSLGFSYSETFQLQQIRSMGTSADAAITNVSKDQYEELCRSSLVSSVGLNRRLGSVDTSKMGDALLGISCLDETEWKEHRMPAISDLQGNYPQAENEVMLPVWALSAMGISSFQLGMNIPISYRVGTDEEYITGDFILSGCYKDYSASRVGNRGSVYVSEIFAAQKGISSDAEYTAMISFSDGSNIELSCERLKDEIIFTDEQSFEIVPFAESNSLPVVLALAAVIVFVIISGYLLIYNILYISVSKDTQFYGQLKTIGATKGQIRKIVRFQIFKTSVVSILSGLIAGGAVSLCVVPFAMDVMYSDSTELGERVSFSPFIFIGAAAFAFFTAAIGSMKPAKIASHISSVEASRYTNVNVKNCKEHKSHRIKLSRMAKNNIFRSPKSAILTFASLFLGLLLFLLSAGLLSSLSPENFAKQWGESDFALTYNISEKEALLSDEMLQRIKEMDKIKNVRVTYASSLMTAMDVVYDQNVFGRYIASLNGVSGLDFSNEETLKGYTDNFWSGVYGIDSGYVRELNEVYGNTVDLKAFENGELVILSAMTDEAGNPLIEPEKTITVVGEYGEHTFTVANGFLDAGFQSERGKVRGTAPDLFISQNALKMLSTETKIFRIAFDSADSSCDEEIMANLKSITASSDGIDIHSRYEKKQEIERYLLTFRILAMGLSSVFLLIGIMNFINTTAVGVNNRRHEFAALESIGMTKKQIAEMLFWEGFYYWAVSFLLLGTVGTGIYISVYSALRKMAPYAALSYPFMPVFAVAAVVLLVCFAASYISFKQEIKQSIAKRLRQS